jgi:hypothetical protein
VYDPFACNALAKAFWNVIDRLMFFNVSYGVLPIGQEARLVFSMTNKKGTGP